MLLYLVGFLFQIVNVPVAGSSGLVQVYPRDDFVMEDLVSLISVWYF